MKGMFNNTLVGPGTTPGVGIRHRERKVDQQCCLNAISSADVARTVGDARVHAIDAIDRNSAS